MSDSEPTGPGLLRQWRKTTGRSQERLAGELHVSQPALCEWEGGTRRPELPSAITLESLSEGAIPIEAWGYSTELIEHLRSLSERRAGTDETAPPGKTRRGVKVAGVR